MAGYRAKYHPVKGDYCPGAPSGVPTVALWSYMRPLFAYVARTLPWGSGRGLIAIRFN